MRLTRREALVRGGGLLGALGLGRFLSPPAAGLEAEQAPIPQGVELVGAIYDGTQGARLPTAEDSLTYVVQQSDDQKAWMDTLHYVCQPGEGPRIRVDDLPMHSRYMRVRIEIT